MGLDDFIRVDNVATVSEGHNKWHFVGNLNRKKCEIGRRHDTGSGDDQNVTVMNHTLEKTESLKEFTEKSLVKWAAEKKVTSFSYEVNVAGSSSFRFFMCTNPSF